MYRQFPGTPGMGGSARRSFRVEEEWREDTLSLQESDARRMTAKVHVVRSPFSVAGECVRYMIDSRDEKPSCKFGRFEFEGDRPGRAGSIWPAVQIGKRIRGTKSDCPLPFIGFTLVCKIERQLTKGVN